MKTKKPTDRISHKLLSKTLALLLRGPVTVNDLMLAANIHNITAQRWLRELKKQNVVHICMWLPDTLGRDAIPLYALGEGNDAQRKSMTGAQRAALFRARKKLKNQQADAAEEPI